MGFRPMKNTPANGP